jgi:hypothetical protein
LIVAISPYTVIDKAIHFAYIHAHDQSADRTMLKYIELKTGYSDNGPAWIARVTVSKSGRTIYFNGRALARSAGRGLAGNHFDVETREEYWISGVKKNGRDRHWAGGGVVLIERAAVEEYLKLIDASELDPSRHRITDEIRSANVEKWHLRENAKLS